MEQHNEIQTISHLYVFVLLLQMQLCKKCKERYVTIDNFTLC